MTKPKAKPTAAAAPTAGEAAAAPVKKSGEKVTVACKLPHGMRLRLFKMVDAMENVAGNTMRTVQRAQQIGPDVVIKGVAVEFGKEKTLSSGFALTPGIDKEFFDEWLRQNQHHDAVKNHLIFAASTRDAVEGEAGDHKKQKSGLEPLDMSMVKKGERLVAADERLPRSNNPNLSPIAADTEKATA